MMSKQYKVLALNPGSTSTKIALYEEEKCVFEEVIRHSKEDLAAFATIYDQYEYRRDLIEAALVRHGFSVADLDAVVGRGGALKPIPGGTYAVNDLMLDDLRHRVQTQHASNLGGLIARGIADHHSLPAFIVDPVCVDEMQPLAKISGWPEMPRRSLFHALSEGYCTPCGQRSWKEFRRSDIGYGTFGRRNFFCRTERRQYDRYTEPDGWWRVFPGTGGISAAQPVD